MSNDPVREPDPSPSLPVRDTERAAAAARLEQAVGHGQLDLNGYIDRLDRSNRARTGAELAEITGDLAPIVGTTPAVVPRSTALFDNVVRAENWHLPARSKATAVFADIELDLRRATITDSEIRIDATCVFGDIRITVPEGVEVVLDSDSVLSDTHSCTLAAVPRIPGTPLIRVQPTGWFGRVLIESRKAGEPRFSTRIREGWRRWRAKRNG
ncbi:DUF1707 domain-containing protein [Tomitella gaofuii]|uniref:DUF1707 domain-containing protein n=1 Tax=Tomitella gaofuii TaxID=2760083 RepID=UPI0015F7AC78|nr:DUF1707 domain-containing protein [Tomitella gaofuii]